MSKDARRAREFESFVAGAAGRLLHAATLLTAEHPDDNPRARRLLAAALAHTYATWDGLRGEDPYARARQQLAVRFARGAWRRHRAPSRPWSTGGAGPGQVPGAAVRQLRAALRQALLPQALRTGADAPADRAGAGRPRGVLHRLTPQERLVLVLRMYEGVAEEQTAALLGLSVERVHTICARAMSTLLHPPSGRTASLPKVVPS
nr:sigma factor-like helix-turn-helix DNA-binding protein [Streptomyces sulfonofaciens]